MEKKAAEKAARTGTDEIIARRLGMTVSDFRAVIAGTEEAATDRLGMSVEDYRRITTVRE